MTDSLVVCGVCAGNSYVIGITTPLPPPDICYCAQVTDRSYCGTCICIASTLGLLLLFVVLPREDTRSHDLTLLPRMEGQLKGKEGLVLRPAFA